MIKLKNMNENSAKNFNMVEMGNKRFYFSYETCVAFYTTGTELVICENIWGTTTGKHLNWLNSDTSIRVKRDEFITKLEEVM